MIDPFGDGDELSSNALLASDGDLETAWRSENYFDGVPGKPGVGVVLDLGDDAEVLSSGLDAAPRLRVPPGRRRRPRGAHRRDRSSVTAAERHARRARGSGRYVLVWITSVVPTATATAPRSARRRRSSPVT